MANMAAWLHLVNKYPFGIFCARSACPKYPEMVYFQYEITEAAMFVFQM